MKKFTDFQMYKSVVLAFVFVIFVIDIGLGQTTVTLDPIGDAYVWEMYPNTNYGSEDNLYIGRDPGGEGNNFLIEWDLSSLPNCIEVTSAEIQVYQWSTISGTVGAYVKRILESWNESTVNWSNQPDVSSSYGTQYFNSSGGWYFVPATNLVQDWLNYGNDGVMFQATTSSTNYQICNSRENIQKIPKLKITYIIVGVEEIDFINDLSIYPNPANDIIYIKTTETGLFIKSLEISDVIGKSVYQIVLNNSNDLIRISVTDFQPGFYFIKLHTNKGVVLNKFIINR